MNDIKKIEICSMVLAAVCCNHVLHSGIDFKNIPVYEGGKPLIINGKHFHRTQKLKGKEKYLIGDFLKRAKLFQDNVNSSIRPDIAGTTIEEAGDDLDEDVNSEQDAINLLTYCVSNLVRFKHLYVRNLRIAIKKLPFPIDIKKGEDLFNQIIDGDLAGGLKIDLMD